MKDKAKEIIDFFIPPSNWKLAATLILGFFIGIVILLLYISNAPSYMSEDPKACVNCHVMSPQYATWKNSSHFNVANCNDCHVPHDNVFRKFLFKASDGLRHTTMFTFRLEPQVIQIKNAGKNVVQENCIRCHENLINVSFLARSTGKNYKHGEGKFCWDCHRETPHGKVNSLASAPYARVPQLSPILPKWITDFVITNKNEMNKKD